MTGLLVPGATPNFFHTTEQSNPSTEQARLEMEKDCLEESNLSAINSFFELVNSHKSLTATEIKSVTPFLYFLAKQKKADHNIYSANNLEIELINAAAKNLIKLASRSYQKKVSKPAINFINYLTQSNLSKNNFVSSVTHLAIAVADFAKLGYASIIKTRETVDKFLKFFENPQSYNSQTALDKTLFKLDVISLAAHQGPNISRLTRTFLIALKEINICKDHPISEMAHDILEDEPNFLTIRKFFKLIEDNNLKEAIVGLFSNKEAWEDYIKTNKTEKETLNHIKSYLLAFVNDQDVEKSKVILDFANYSRQSRFTENPHALDLAKTIFSIGNFLKLKISPVFKNTFLNYLQTDNILTAKEKEKLNAHLVRFANTADLAVARPVSELLSCLSQAELWTDHSASNLAMSVLSEKEKNTLSIGAFTSLVSQAEEKNKSKRSDIEKFSLKLSSLLKSEKTQIINSALRKQINELIRFQYNQITGEIHPTKEKEKVKVVMNFLNDLVKSRKWNNQEANKLALDIADMIIALRDFLEIKISQDRKITNDRILDFKNLFFAYLQTDADSTFKKTKERQRFIKFERDLNDFTITSDKKISNATKNLITFLNKLDVWEDHRILSTENYNFKIHAISSLIQEFSELLASDQISNYFKNHKKGNILEAIEEDMKFFFTLLTNESMLKILSPDYARVSGRDIRAELTKRLTFLVNEPHKQVAGATLNLLNHLKNPEWARHPGQDIASTVLLKFAMDRQKNG